MVRSLGANPEPDTVALSTLAARRALALVAAVMHVPAVHATLLEQQGLLQPPTTPSVIMVTAHIRPFVKCHSACVPNSSSINALRSSRAMWCSNQAAVKADHLNLCIHKLPTDRWCVHGCAGTLVKAAASGGAVATGSFAELCWGPGPAAAQSHPHRSPA